MIIIYNMLYNIQIDQTVNNKNYLCYVNYLTLII